MQFARRRWCATVLVSLVAPPWWIEPPPGPNRGPRPAQPFSAKLGDRWQHERVEGAHSRVGLRTKFVGRHNVLDRDTVDMKRSAVG